MNNLIIMIASIALIVETLDRAVSNLVTAPYSNTGADSQTSTSLDILVEARIDSLSLLWVFEGSARIRNPIKRFLGVEFDWSNPVPRKIGILWDRCYTSPEGVLYSERDGCHGQVHCRLSISGQVCSRISNLKLRGFSLWCSANLRGLRCSRIDLAIDDFGKRIDYKKVCTALHQKNYAGFNVGDIVENVGSKFHGWTIYLGRRSSDRFVRAYNKYAESKGKIDSYRWEVEFKGDLANVVFASYLEFPDDEELFQRSIINYSVGHVKFLEKVDKNISRCPLLSWWQEWLDYLKASPIKARCLRAATSVVTKKQWIDRAVSKSLSIISDAIGVERFQHYLSGAIKDAKRRYNRMDDLILEDYRKCVGWGIEEPIVISLTTEV